MDGREYLNQISAEMKPAEVAGGKGGILHSKFFVVGMIGVIGLVLIMILGMIAGGGKGSEKDKSIELLLHLNGTAEVLNDYKGYVKSSSLRSDSTSLYGVLTTTSRALGKYLEDKYKFKEKEAPKKMTEKAEKDKTELDNELFEAKINGLLDRAMARKMSYEISLFVSEEASLLKMAKNEELKKTLNESYGSLQNLYGSFDEFSEAQ